MLNKLNAYEKIENGIIKLRYGISIIEYNTTNNLNVPAYLNLDTITYRIRY